MYNVGIIISGGPPFGTAPTNHEPRATKKRGCRMKVSAIMRGPVYFIVCSTEFVVCRKAPLIGELAAEGGLRGFDTAADYVMSCGL